jgi:hypothetical protein
MKIYRKKYDIRQILFRKINYTSKIITYANPYSRLDKKTNANISNNENISRNINSTYIKDKNKKKKCNDDTFYYDDNEINNEDAEGYIILPDIDPPNCKSPNCSYLLDMYGEPFKDNNKTQYKRDILYHNYTLKTNGDEEDVDTLIKLILEEINDIQDKIENQIKITKESFDYDNKAEECYDKLFNDDDDDDDDKKKNKKNDKKTLKNFQKKINYYSQTTVKINNELLKNNFDITI